MMNGPIYRQPANYYVKCEFRSILLVQQLLYDSFILWQWEAGEEKGRREEGKMERRCPFGKRIKYFYIEVQLLKNIKLFSFNNWRISEFLMRG